MHRSTRSKPSILPKVESVLFCNYTPFSQLKKLLQAEEDKINGTKTTCRVRVIERAGPKIKDMLSNNKPWLQVQCGKECAPCNTKPGQCKTASVTYQIVCINCQEKGQKAIYIGESARTFYDRARDHEKALKAKNTTYGVVRHWQECHSDMLDPPKYSYKFLKKHRTYLKGKSMKPWR